MGAVLERILDISLSGSVIILVVLLLRLALKRAPRRAVCLLWVLAIARLLIPFEIVSDLSLQPDVRATDLPVVSQVQLIRDSFDSGTGSVTIDGEEAPGIALDMEEIEQNTVVIEREVPIQVLLLENLEEILGWVWLGTAVAFGVYGVASYVNLKRRVRGAVILEEGVWVCPGLDTAFVLGFFRPQIYLPVLPDREREFVLAHERNHIRRLDHWWKLAAYGAVSLHWFNPLAWVTYVLLCRDMEMACDEETVRGMDDAQRKAYSAALLNCATRRSGIAACPVAFGEIGVKGRIKNVLNYKKPGFWATLLALIAAVTVAVCFLTSPGEPTDLEKCEEALKQWKKLDTYHMHTETANVGDYVINESASADYWVSGEERVSVSQVDLGNLYIENWYAWLDGTQYCRTYERDSLTEEESDTGWAENESPDRVDTESLTIPWLLRLDWDSCGAIHKETQTTPGGENILVEVLDDVYGSSRLEFCFEDGELVKVIQTTVWAREDEDDRDDILATISTTTMVMMDTDEAEIRSMTDIFGESDTARTEAWNSDIDYLTSVMLEKYPRLNSGNTVVSYFSLGEETDAYTDALYDEELRNAFLTEIESLKGRVGELSDQEIVYELQRILATLGDSWTMIRPDYDDSLPVVFEPIYENGSVELYATRLPASHEDLLMARLTGMNGVPIGQVVERMLPYISCENEYWAMNRLTNMFGGGDLTRKDMLVAAGICQPGDERVELTLQTASGTVTVELEFLPAEAHKAMERVSCSLLHSDLPPYEYLAEKGYWYEVLENDTLYIRLHDMEYTGDRTFDNFLQEAAAVLRDAGAPMKLVIDLRLSYADHYPISEVASFVGAVNRYGCDGAYVLIDGNTCFLATSVAYQLRQGIDGAVLVGSPTGNSENGMIYFDQYELPNSGYRFQCPSGYQVTNPDNASNMLTPDLAVWQTLADYENGVDTVLSFVLDIGKTEEDPTTPTGYDLTAEEQAALDGAWDWFRNLRAEDVACIDLQVHDCVEHTQCAHYTGQEMAALVAMLNGFVSETPIADPETYYGGTSVTLCVTMCDGTVHHVTNVCDRYMTLDGVAFEVYADWLEQWPHECAQQTEHHTDHHGEDHH